jgi:hypothetical protein
MKRPSVKELEKLWSECVKARAGYKSEYSEKKEGLNSHHIHGKPSHRLRFELDNGVCITSGEHFFIAHHAGRSGEFKKWAMELRNFDEDKANEMKRGTSDLFAVQIYLNQKLKEFKRV